MWWLESKKHGVIEGYCLREDRSLCAFWDKCLTLYVWQSKLKQYVKKASHALYVVWTNNEELCWWKCRREKIPNRNLICLTRICAKYVTISVWFLHSPYLLLHLSFSCLALPLTRSSFLSLHTDLHVFEYQAKSTVGNSWLTSSLRTKKTESSGRSVVKTRWTVFCVTSYAD